MQIKIVQDSAKVKRKVRSPTIDTSFLCRPYAIVPYCFMPVLPGETMTNLWWSLNCISDPLRVRSQVGWLDTMYFYVKHSQLDIAASLIDMHVDGNVLPDAGATARLAGADKLYWTAAGGVPYEKLCVEHVVKWYFRDEGEALIPETGLIDGFLPAQIQRDGWWQSMQLATVLPGDENLLPGEFPEAPNDGTDEAVWATRYAQWTKMRNLGLTDASYEDYLRAQGVASVADDSDEELKRPELLARDAEFVTPANTVEPSTGYPSTAHVKTMKGAEKRNRFFKEPGFIVGIMIWRPKVTMGNIAGGMSGFMDSYADWMPASLQGQPYSSIKIFNEATGPAPIQATGDTQVVVDLRDFLLYGEQRQSYWVNQVATPALKRTTGLFYPALPRTLTADVKYLTDAEAIEVFLTPADPVYMRADGLVSFSINSQIGTDTTP
jgi:hypothetical protein